MARKKTWEDQGEETVKRRNKLQEMKNKRRKMKGKKEKKKKKRKRERKEERSSTVQRSEVRRGH